MPQITPSVTLLLALVVATASARTLKLCYVIPFGGSYQQVVLGGMLAAEHINSDNYTFISSNALLGSQTLRDLEVKLHMIAQGTKTETYDAVEECLNAGGIGLIGPAYSSRSVVLSQYLLRQRHIPAISFSATSPGEVRSTILSPSSPIHMPFLTIHCVLEI